MIKPMYIVLSIITLLVTVILFYLIAGDVDKTGLFYVNLINSCFLELIFFGFIGFARTQTSKGTGAIKSILGSYSALYIIVNLATMIAFSLFLVAKIPLIFYISALIVITLIWIITGYITIETDANYATEINELKRETYDINYYSEKMKLLERMCLSVYSEKGYVYKTESSNATELSPLLNKFMHLTPNILRNTNANNELNQILNKGEELLEELKSVDQISNELTRKIKGFVEQSIRNIDMLKSISRS